MRSRILDLLSSKPTSSFTRSAIASEIALSPDERRALEGALQTLVSESLVEVVHRRYRLARAPGTVAGAFHAARGGYGFITPETGPPGPDLFVPPRHTLGAFDGDRVLAAVLPGRKGSGTEARVVKILARSKKPVVGLVQRGYLLPAGGYLPPIALPRGGAPEGSVASVFLSGEEVPVCERVVPLGDLEDPQTPVRAAEVRYALSHDFSAEALQEADKLREGFSPGDCEGRTDFRELPTVTVDPSDAKDFDDALSVFREGESFRLFIHIADVSHYVKAGSALDAEARRRGNTTYLPGVAYHMLPSALAADMCSLVAGKPRLTLTVEMLLNGQGRVTAHRAHKGVICSSARLSYEEAQAILDGEGRAPETLQSLLRGAHELSRRLFRRRLAKGSLDLDLPEASLRFGHSGRVEEILPSVRLDSHRIVEEAMVLCNEVVAGDLVRTGAPGLFRVHPEPDPKKLEELRPLLNALGLGEASRGDLSDPFVLQKVLHAAQGHRASKLVAYLVLRAMSQARYSPASLPHYGLGLQHYCHFTSPIRRYPDLAAHRSLKSAVLGEAAGDEGLEALAAHCSRTERESEQAEREVVAWHQMAFLSERLGETFEALILGFSRFGIRVELVEHLVEGICPFGGLDGDYWTVGRDGLSARGRRGGRVLKVGEVLRVRLVRVDRLMLEAQFELEASRAVVSRERRVRYNRP